MKRACTIICPEQHDIEIMVADAFWSRFKGLMGTRSLAPFTGLLLADCNAIHMFFMHYALDIVFIDDDYTIIKVVENVRPWHISICHKAKHTIEVPVGTIVACGWQCGMQLKRKK